MKTKRTVYSVRRARLNLTHAIKAEAFGDRYIPHSQLVYAREQAVRDLISAVRAEKKP